MRFTSSKQYAVHLCNVIERYRKRFCGGIVTYNIFMMQDSQPHVISNGRLHTTLKHQKTVTVCR